MLLLKMGEKDDEFGLSLSLSLGGVNQQQQPPSLNHMHQPQQQQPVPMNHNKTLFGDLFQLPGTRFLLFLKLFFLRFLFLDSPNLFVGIFSPNFCWYSIFSPTIFLSLSLQSPLFFLLEIKNK